MRDMESILIVLNEHASEIKSSLGAQWDEFMSGIEKLAEHFVVIGNETDTGKADDMLKAITDDLVKACKRYDYTRNLLDERPESVPEAQIKRPKTSDKPDITKISAKEMANRCQPLVSKLREVDKTKKGQR